MQPRADLIGGVAAGLGIGQVDLDAEAEHVLDHPQRARLCDRPSR